MKAGEKENLIRVLLIGAGKGGASILKELSLLDNVRVEGVADLNPKASGALLARERGIPVWQDFRPMLKLRDYDVVIEATGLREISKEIQREKRPDSVLIVAEAALLMMRLIERHEELRDIKRDVIRLSAIMDAAQEGIQMADNAGTILYTNKAFGEITKTSAGERIGKNVFDVSPDVYVYLLLRTGRPVLGKINKVQSTGVEVISNASPLIVNGNIQGAVALFRNISDMKKISRKLEESQEVIRNLKEEIRELTAPRYSFEDIIGKSAALERQLQIARFAAKDAETILLTGESGTGKELLAHALHAYGSRAGGPFVKVDCAAIPANLLESTLFGYEKGAYTGAVKSKMGKFELAWGGTIFLDEIGELELGLQSKLLRVLQDREMERVGGSYPIKANVRVIAATNKNLLDEVAKGTFRLDLYYRLNLISIELPPLRQRKGDIPLLAAHMLEKFNSRYNKECCLSQEALQVLEEYRWPGNIRELNNFIERMVILSPVPYITEETVRFTLSMGRDSEPEEEENLQGPLTLREIEKRAITQALERNGTSLAGKKQAARELGISLATLYNKMNKKNSNSLKRGF